MGVDAVALAVLAYVFWTYAWNASPTYRKWEKRPLVTFLMSMSTGCAFASLINVIWDIYF